MKALEAFIEPSEAPQRSVKIKIKVNFYFNINFLKWAGREELVGYFSNFCLNLFFDHQTISDLIYSWLEKILIKYMTLKRHRIWIRSGIWINVSYNTKSCYIHCPQCITFLSYNVKRPTLSRLCAISRPKGLIRNKFNLDFGSFLWQSLLKLHFGVSPVNFNIFHIGHSYLVWTGDFKLRTNFAIDFH